MMWKKITQSFNEAVDILSKQAVDGNPDIEKMRCAYTLNEDELIYILPALDFIDLDPQADTIKSFTLYQVIE